MSAVVWQDKRNEDAGGSSPMKRNKPSEQRNPFLSPPAAPTPLVTNEDGEEQGRVSYAGAPKPAGAPAPEAPPLVLPPWVSDRRYAPPRLARLPLLQVAALHGGAGATTVAAMLGTGVVDCGQGLWWLWSVKTPVLLVARTHGRGLDLVRRAGQQWSSGGLAPLQLLGLVLIADAPEPGALRRQVESASRIFPTTWRLDWNDELRTNPIPPAAEQLPSRLRRIRKDVLGKAHTALANAEYYPNTVRRTS